MRHLSLLRFLAFTTSSADSTHSGSCALHDISKNNAKAHVVPPINVAPSARVRKLKSALLAKDTISGGRRDFFAAATTGTLAFLTATSALGTSSAHALDMEGFANSQLEADTKNCNPKTDSKCQPQLSADQALCQYGQIGQARSEACQRIRVAGGVVPAARPGGSTPGGAYAL